MFGGVLATASDLIFCGEMDGHLSAFSARTGKKLWSFNLGVAVGATLGSIVIASGASYTQLPWIGMTCSIVALTVFTITHSTRRVRPVPDTP